MWEVEAKEDLQLKGETPNPDLGPAVPQVRDPVDSSHKSCNEGSLLGMHSISSVSRDDANADGRIRDQKLVVKQCVKGTISWLICKCERTP